jgi:DNA-binding IscR family transcriptional regulator
MKISSRFTVAVHILSLIYITKDNSCTSEWIAGSVNTNPVVIRRIIGMLKNAGLLDVHPGVGGAYILKDLAQITLLDIYNAVEVVEEDGLFQLHQEPNPNCPVGANIHSVLELVLSRAQDAMEQILADITIKDIIDSLINKIE